MSDDPLYCYPGTNILRNKFYIQDRDEIERIERRVALERELEGAPEGNFDLEHLQAIHRHLFQDIYEWAGEVREVEISKGESQFQPLEFVERGMADVYRRLESADFLRGLDADQFAAAAGKIIGDVNYVHPFREGNGRTQREYLRQLASEAGHDFRIELLDQEQWIDASIEAHRCNYEPMAKAIRSGIVTERQIEKVDQGIEPDWLKPLEKRQDREMDSLQQEHHKELSDLSPHSDRHDVLSRQASEMSALAKDHQAELARRMEDERRAQKLIKEMEERKRSRDHERDLGDRGRSR
ncbi:MAG: Fic family protein [Brevundimonas sp.]|uniref:Fic/DOC family protein n=1 Tax=Brevundimonas sp. TaxID=1871086 RepID=UPI00258951A2|nr:Fic family protein [Brevundimonas sp.]MCV0415957.1 Fic family protein [Brevundimonas sp.]